MDDIIDGGKEFLGASEMFRRTKAGASTSDNEMDIQRMDSVKLGLPSPLPDPLSSSHNCGGCGKLEPVYGNPHKVCTRCRSVYYCSIDCQTKHWKRKKRGHKSECKPFPRIDLGNCSDSVEAVVAKALKLMSERHLEILVELSGSERRGDEDIHVAARRSLESIQLPGSVKWRATVHPDGVTECPTCLKSMPMDSPYRLVHCCGKRVCHECYSGAGGKRGRFNSGPGDRQECPFCGEALASAQLHAGVEVGPRVKWLTKGGGSATGEPHVEAMVTLAHYHDVGYGGCKRSQTKAWKLLHRAALMGHARAIRSMHLLATNGPAFEELVLAKGGGGGGGGGDSDSDSDEEESWKEVWEHLRREEPNFTRHESAATKRWATLAADLNDSWGFAALVRETFKDIMLAALQPLSILNGTIDVLGRLALIYW